MPQCVDVATERCSQGDRFLIDTNVVIDLTSSAPRFPAYAEFVGRAKRARAEVAVSTLTFLEFVTVVERQHFLESKGRAPVDSAELKSRRADPAARRAVVERTRVMWAQVASFATVLDADVTSTTVSAMLSALSTSALDAYDLALVAEARRHRISTIVTHDADFATASGVIVFTANRKLLS